MRITASNKRKPIAEAEQLTAGGLSIRHLYEGNTCVGMERTYTISSTAYDKDDGPYFVTITLSQDEAARVVEGLTKALASKAM